jgi:hypothetical protein
MCGRDALSGETGECVSVCSIAHPKRPIRAHFYWWSGDTRAHPHPHPHPDSCWRQDSLIHSKKISIFCQFLSLCNSSLTSIPPSGYHPLHQSMMLTTKFGKSVDFVIKLPIYQNYLESDLYGQNWGPDRVKDGKCRTCRSWKFLKSNSLCATRTHQQGLEAKKKEVEESCLKSAKVA